MSCPRAGSLPHPFIRLAHQTDPDHSIEELKVWIAGESAIEAAHQILMTARGKQVKLQNLRSEVRSYSAFGRRHI